MKEVQIDAERLKTIRKARKIGRPKLAKLSGITERQMGRIETAGNAVLDASLVIRLSDALQVPPQTLTGEFQMVAEDLEQAQAPKCTSGCCG